MFLLLLLGIGQYYSLVDWTAAPARIWLAPFSLVGACLCLALITPLTIQWTRHRMGPYKLLFLPETLYEDFTLTVADETNPNVITGSLVLLLPIGLGIILFGYVNPSI